MAGSLSREGAGHRGGAFHHTSGEGYKVFSEELEKIDQNNPQLAARAAKIFSKVTKLHSKYHTLAKTSISQMLTKPISPEVLRATLSTDQPVSGL